MIERIQGEKIMVEFLFDWFNVSGNYRVIFGFIGIIIISIIVTIVLMAIYGDELVEILYEFMKH